MCVMPFPRKKAELMSLTGIHTVMLHSHDCTLYMYIHVVVKDTSHIMHAVLPTSLSRETLLSPINWTVLENNTRAPIPTSDLEILVSQPHVHVDAQLQCMHNYTSKGVFYCTHCT